ncbi:MAG: hypothetical protein CMK59_00915 [Proteobacteria bacterium]|nr:hypothetical protein [Pseudomonadota bacterium]
MPIYEYRCQQCDSIIEVFQHSSELSPKICGYRCSLSPESIQKEHRGFGELKRILSTIGGNVRPQARKDRPSIKDAERAGFRVYKNEGDGTVSQLAGAPDPTFPKDMLKK